VIIRSYEDLINEYSFIMGKLLLGESSASERLDQFCWFAPVMSGMFPDVSGNRDWKEGGMDNTTTGVNGWTL